MRVKSGQSPLSSLLMVSAAARPGRDDFARLPLKRRISRALELVRVLTGTDLKLRYGESALGYLWTVGKPLALFSTLYVVFGVLLRFGSPLPHYPLYLLIGVMLWAFFADGVSRTMSSIVDNGSLLRKLAFPRIVIPLSSSVTALITFGLSVVTIAIFVASNRLAPRPEWLLIMPELLELYLFVLGLGLLLAPLYVRLRDVTLVWEVTLQMLFFLSPIIYPFALVPPLGRQLMLLNPFTQVMQDIRALLISHGDVIAAPAAFSPLRLLPILVTVVVLGSGLWLFKREEPWFAERV